MQTHPPHQPPPRLRVPRYNNRMNARGRVLIFFLSLIVFSQLSLAQSASADVSGGISLSLTPERPAPGNTVRISAASFSPDLERSDITWYANDKIIAQGPGLKGIDVTAGPLGSETHVVAVAQTADGTSNSGDAFIRPTEIDLLWESDSYIPPFYRGRALPSAGTSLRLQAVPRFKLPSGALVPEQDIIFTWRRNGSVVQSVSGRGRSSARLQAPVLFGTDIVTVEAASLDGSLQGSASVRVPSVEPVLQLYLDPPLFGVMYNQALGQQTAIADSEMSFAAVPYFAQAQSPNDSRLIYGWKVNGTDIEADPGRPSELTINSDKSTGLAQIALSLTHSANWFMQSLGAWAVSFSGNGALGAGSLQTQK